MKRLLELALVLLLAGCQTPPAPPPPLPAPVCPEPPPPPPEVDELKVVIGQAEDLRKALALGKSGAELAQAAAQVDAVAADAQAEPLRQLAFQLSARLAEQRRLQESLDKLTQQLRDSQRRSEQLNEKLEALKAIEQTLPVKR
ncbi:MAG TPA: hypothetical protein VIN58_23605 [Roseateles sp.]